MRTATLFLAAIGTGLFAQSPSQLKLPSAVGRIVDSGAPAAAADPGRDIISRYGSKRESAIAALKAGTEAAQVRRPERAMGLFLLAVRRDPGLASALYNLGVMCATQERWSDAISFYKEAAALDSSIEMRRLTQADLSRVQLIASLESTPEGKRTRQFDIAFLTLLGKTGSPVIRIEQAVKLAATEPTRWELQALIGELQAEAGKYDESAKALDSAAKIAPAERRKALTAAAELARREASFGTFVSAGNDSWQKEEYSAAAKAYASAWETNPGADQIALQAATGFLMADEVPLAVQTLDKLRQTGGTETRTKAVQMLKELGAVSAEAKELAQANPGGVHTELVLDIGDRIQALLGDLTSSDMQLATKGNPTLLRDETRFVPVPDEELTSNASEALLMSTQSVFEMYRKSRAADQPASDLSAPGGDNSAPAAPDATSPASEPSSLPGHPQKLDRPAGAGEASPAAPAGGKTTGTNPPRPA